MACVLVLWIAATVGLSLLFQAMGYGYAYGWAHAKRPPAFREMATFLGWICLGLAMLGGLGFVLHRIVVATRRPLS